MRYYRELRRYKNLVGNLEDEVKYLEAEVKFYRLMTWRFVVTAMCLLLLLIGASILYATK